MTRKLKEQFEKLKIQRSKNNPKPNPKSKPIQSSNKKWKDLDEKLNSLANEELLHGLSNLQMKSTVLSFKKRQERRKNLREKNYDSEEDKEEDKEEARKLADQIKISKEFWEKYNKQRKQNPFFYSDDDMGSSFGKKQKKDIKGMIKKILLYGGLPTLLLVSLGVLSNKKFGKGKIKKNIKVKVSEKEKRFKQVVVKQLKKMILKRKQELDGMKKDSRDNEIQLQNREIRRQKKIKIKKPSSNPQSSAKSPPREVSLQTIEERQQQKIPSNKIFIRIDKSNQEWFNEEEKNSNYYFNKEDGKIYNKTSKKPSKYIYTENDGLGLRTGIKVIPFFKTEKLKK